MAAANAALDQLPDIRDARMEINSDDERDPEEDEEEESGVRQVIQMVRATVALYAARQADGGFYQDLGLGVFEQRIRGQESGSDDSSSSDSSTDSSSSDDDSDEEPPRARQLSARQQNADSDSDSDSDDEPSGLSILDAILAQASSEPGRRPVRPLPQRAQRHPGITVLSSNDSDMATDSQHNPST